MMRLFIIRRSISLICFFSLLFCDVTGELRVCALRVSFNSDDDESTTGNGQFLAESNGVDCDTYTIDPSPHNKTYFASQLKAVDEYFKDVSYGKFGFDLNLSSVFPDGDNDSYSLTNTMNYYNPYNQDDVKEERITKFFSDAINEAYLVDQIDFSSYDLIVVFHAGIGQDFSLPFLDPTPEDIPSTYVDNKMLLEHLGTSSIAVGNHEIPHGIILPETQNHLLYDIAESMFSSASQPCEYQYGLTGTFALMVGFAIGLPPLWNIETGESGVGVFGLMDQGSNNGRGFVPSPPTAWTRIFAGWESPTSIDFSSAVNLKSRSENNLAKIPINDSEYFLIENRDNTIHDGINLDSMRYAMWESNGETNYPPLIEVLQDSAGIEKDENGVIISVPNYDIGLPASGLLIWHIDETAINEGIDNFSVNTNLSRLGVDLEESDGAQDIGYPSIHIFSDPSAGYFGDMWFKGNTQYELANPSMEDMSPEFGPFTYPPTNANDGSSTFISIGDISTSGDTMSFSVSNSLMMDGFPIMGQTILNSFIASGHTKILGSGDSLWIAPIDTISNKISFHAKKDTIFKYFIVIDEQENHTLIDVFEWPNVDPGYSPIDYTQSKTRYDYNHLNNSVMKILFEENFHNGSIPIWADSLIYLSNQEWESHKKRIFSNSFNYGIDLENTGISLTGFDGTISKWENISFKSISGIDLDLDANVDVLALDSTGILYAFNSDLILMAGFPLEIELQSPILARDLFNDGHPEIVAKSADSSSIYIFNHQGKVQYQITSNKMDELFGVKPIDGKNSILTRHSIYQFNDETESNGNEWAFEHGDWGRSRTVNLDYTFESETENHHIRSYCYPNPIRDNSGTIRVETIGAEDLEVNLYDLAGYFIKSFSEDFYQSGKQITEWVWDVSDIESGVYFAHVAVRGDNEKETSIIKIAVIH